MILEIVWSAPANRDMARLDPPVEERVRKAISELAASGRGDVKKLKGMPALRLRVGDWRVIFTFDHVGDGSPSPGFCIGARCIGRGMAVDLRLRGTSPVTQRMYLGCAQRFAAYHHQAPTALGEAAVRAFLVRARGARGDASSTG